MLSLPGWGSVIFIISYDTLKKFPVCFQGRPDKQTNKTSQGRSTPPHLWPGADHKEILTCHCPKVYHNEPLHSEGVLGCLYSKEGQQEEIGGAELQSSLLAAMLTQWYLQTKEWQRSEELSLETFWVAEHVEFPARVHREGREAWPPLWYPALCICIFNFWNMCTITHTQNILLSLVLWTTQANQMWWGCRVNSFVVVGHKPNLSLWFAI